MKKLTPVLTAGGQQLHAAVLRGNAPAEDGRLAHCECGAKVGWVKSPKTGRWYVANTQPSQNPDSARVFILSFSPHKCSGAAGASEVINREWTAHKAEFARLENEQEQAAFAQKEWDHERGITLRDRVALAGKTWSQVMEDNESFDGEPEITESTRRRWAMVNGLQVAR